MSFLRCWSLSSRLLSSLSRSVPAIQSSSFCRFPIVSHLSAFHRICTPSVRPSSPCDQWTRKLHVTPMWTQNGLLQQLHERAGPPERRSRSCRKGPVKGRSMRKAIVLRTIIRHPVKPNSGNKKCVVARLVFSGRETTAIIPGEGHNLQEHSQVLLKGGKRKGLIGIKSAVVRGMLDCAPVKKKTRQQ